MPIKLNIQPSSKGTGSPTPVPPPTIPHMISQSGSGTGGSTASHPPLVPSFSTTASSSQNMPALQSNPQPPFLPLASLAIMPKLKTPRPRQRKTPPSLGPAAPRPQPQQKHLVYPDDDDEEYPAPPYSPITPPSAVTPPPLSSNNKTGASSSPMFPPPAPKTVTHIPPPVIPPNFASMGGRAPLTHLAHPSTVATAAPPPLQPIDFNENMDVIALQAAIGILLRQKQQAEADIRQLNKAKNAAMNRPMEFYNDLVGGRVTQGTARTQDDEDDEDDDVDDDDIDNDNNDEAGEKDIKTKQEGVTIVDALKPSAMEVEAPIKTQGNRKRKSKGKGKSTAITSNNSDGPSEATLTTPPPWANLPKQQDIVRMPAINWSQYAVAGEALDKIHHSQLTHPTRGVPAVISPDGTYDFISAMNPDDGKRVVGISAPFNPLLDRVVHDKKPTKGGVAGGPQRGGT